MGDTYWDDVDLLLAGGETHGSTTIVDSSASGLSPTLNGTSPQYSNVQSRWASTSIKSTAGWLDYNITLGSAWTVDGWIRPSASGSTQYIVHNRDGADTDVDWALYHGDTDLFLRIDGQSRYIESITMDVWTFFRISYNGTYFYFQTGDTVHDQSGFGSGPYEQSGLSFSDNVITCFGFDLLTSYDYEGYAEDIRVTPGVVRTGNAPTAAFPQTGNDPSAYVLDAGPLQQPAVVAESWSALVADTGPLQSPQSLAWVQFASVAVPSMLDGAVSAVAWHDYTTAINPGDKELYVMDLTTPGGEVRVPIKSWQATLQLDTANYVQCVIPAVEDWITEIESATNFTIYRIVEIGSVTIEQLMATADTELFNTNKGPVNYTGVLSGYTSSAFAEDAHEAYERTLEGIRSISTGPGGTRVRCRIDTLLRPGYTAIADGSPFVTSYINYYALSSGAYMDVGERA